MNQLAVNQVNQIANHIVDFIAIQKIHIVDQTHIVTQNHIVNHQVTLIVIHIADHIVDNNYVEKSIMDRYYKKGEVVNGYSIIKEIGEGRYGIVYLAINDKNEKCVVKQLKLDMLEVTRENLFYEERILTELNDSKFPKFISKFKDKYCEGYLLEYVEGIVFEDLLVEVGHEFSKKEIYQVADKLLDLVDILHSRNIVHRDIRLPNIIIKENKEFTLIDFGLARYIDKNHEKEIDYWYLGDFLLHLYYSSYIETDNEERPWYEELDLNDEEKIFIKRLMGLEKSYTSIEEIRNQLNKIRSIS